MVLPQVLIDAMKYLDSIPNINSGGCGIVTIALKRVCVRHNISTGDIAILEPHEDRFEKNFKIYSQEKTLKNIFPIWHIGLKIQNVIIDSSGFIEENQFFNFSVPEQHLLDIINGNGWNFMFDRKYHTPKIADKLGVYLGDIDLFIGELL